MSTPIGTPLTFAQIQCFVAVVDAGSLSAAGRLLGLTTSGVSRTISRLEQSRGVRLLNRSTHALSLTQEGERLIELARTSLRALAEVEAAMGDLAGSGVVGRVRVSAPTAFLSAGLVPLLPRFRAAHPDILLDLRGSDPNADLAEEGIDLALRMGPVEGIPGHLRQVLLRFGRLTCAAPAYLHARGVPATPAALLQHDRIGFRNQRTGRVEAWRYGETLGWNPPPVLISDDANAALAAAIEGVGVIWAPSWLVARACRAGELVSLLGDWPSEQSTLSIIRRDGDHSPARFAQVIAFLRGAAAELQARP